MIKLLFQSYNIRVITFVSVIQLKTHIYKFKFVYHLRQVLSGDCVNMGLSEIISNLAIEITIHKQVSVGTRLSFRCGWRGIQCVNWT